MKDKDNQCELNSVLISIASWLIDWFAIKGEGAIALSKKAPSEESD